MHMVPPLETPPAPVQVMAALVIHDFHTLRSVECVRWHQALVAFGPTEVLRTCRGT